MENAEGSLVILKEDELEYKIVIAQENGWFYLKCTSSPTLTKWRTKEDFYPKPKENTKE